MSQPPSSSSPPPPSPPSPPPTTTPPSVHSFQSHLTSSTRILAIIGAGLSASSGLPTFRDEDGTASLWATYDAQLISSPAGWARDPGLVWHFYSSRRRDALAVSPNAGHYALVRLATQKPGMVLLSQNVDGLFQRAGMVDNTQLKLLHGDLFSLRCEKCGHEEHDNRDEPLCDVLSESEVRRRGEEVNVLGAGITGGQRKPPKVSALLFEGIARKNRSILGEGKYVDVDPTMGDGRPLRGVLQGEQGGEEEEVDTGSKKPVLHSGIERDELPQCPRCKEEGKASLLRPGVVWFGEPLAEEMVREVDELIESEVDLCMVIGTSNRVWPAAGFCERARARGARVAWINTREEDLKGRREEDWVFLGDAAVILPEILGMKGEV